MKMNRKIIAFLMSLILLCSFAAYAEEAVELTAEQLEALDNLPEGFSREIVADKMMQSKACKHTSFYVWDEEDDASYVYEYIDRGSHRYTYKIVKRHLYCDLCGGLLQSIDADETVTGTTYHWWDNTETPSQNIFQCDECETTIQVNWPCRHKELIVAEDANAYCSVCGAIVVLNTTQYIS